MRIIFIFVFVFASALQNLNFGQVDTMRTDSILVEETEMDTLIDIDPYPFLPDSLQEKYISFSRSIVLDSSEWRNFIDRANLISGSEERLLYFEIFGNEKVFQDALDDYTSAIDLRPYSHRGYLERAFLHQRFHNYKEAIEDYDKALDKAWDSETKIEIRAYRARIKAKMGQHDIAIKDLEKVLKLNNQNPTLLNTLALIYNDLKDHSKALYYLNRSLEYHPEHKKTLSNLGFIALEAGKYEKAINILDKQIEKEDDWGIKHSNRGFAKFKLGQKEEALEDLNKSIELNPINSFAYKYRAIVYFDLGKNEEACADLMEAKRLGYTIEYGDEVVVLLFEKCLEVNRKPSRE